MTQDIYKSANVFNNLEADNQPANFCALSICLTNYSSDEPPCATLTHHSHTHNKEFRQAIWQPSTHSLPDQEENNKINARILKRCHYKSPGKVTSAKSVQKTGLYLYTIMQIVHYYVNFQGGISAFIASPWGSP